MVGGSYPGALAAWFKSQYPYHALGAWSSSGVIHPILDFYQADNDVYLKTSASNNSCVENIQAIMGHVASEFQTPEGITRICTLFGIDESTLDKNDFNNMLADIWGGPVQYGQRVQMCDQFAANS